MTSTIMNVLINFIAMLIMFPIDAFCGVFGHKAPMGTCWRCMKNVKE